MIDLSLVSMEDIWEEIKKRNDAALLVTLRNLDNAVEASDVSFCGGKFTCVGLAESAKAKIMHTMKIETEKGGGEE